MNLLFSLYVLVLFFVLTPGILVTLPKNGSKMMVTAVHGAIFAAVLFFTGHSVWRMTEEAFEGFKEGNRRNRRNTQNFPPGYKKGCLPKKKS